jgi:type II secretory pathway pseudopilin PulG
MNSYSPIRNAVRSELLDSSSSLGAPGPSHLGTGDSTRPRKAIPASEQGYVMLIAIFLMALLALSLTIAAPKIARSIQRDRDLETFHRGMQYRRAIKLYYAKFHAYPPNLEALINTNDIRFLRKKYTDPITGKADWKPVLFGQNKTPTAMGFFGQPLAGNASTLAGTGPSGGGTGTVPTNPTGTSGATPSPGTTPSGISGDATSAANAAPTFGGAGIIGFSPASDKTSILVYKKKNHYNEWEFTYDPLSDQPVVGGGNAGLTGTPGTNPTTPPVTPTLGGPPPTGPPETQVPQ